MNVPKWRRIASLTCTALLLTGCASINRGCAASNAENFGADWVITQFDMNGHVFNCWKLHDVSVANEDSSDGIHWAEGNLGHLVHVSGWYNRVQVNHGDFASAAAMIGVDANKCGNGHYPFDTTQPAGPN